ncbi:MAG: SbcC/MukB-like Walker B domain-containing protein, partial [Acidithiobacillus sp.]|uniref:SbcC/MukB-like Walker B domain-containing protein n=1 Tax=Acidithiobacillus sp. TaxID=1872118 RepID=UPI00355EBE82
INADIIIKEEEFDSLNKLYESQKEILEIINENDKNLHLKYNNIEKKENQIQKLNDDIKNLNVKIQNKLNEEQNNKEKLEKCNNDKQENIKKIEKINQIFTEMDISNLKVKYQKINDKNNEVNAEIKVIKSKNSSIDIEIKKMQNNKTGICPIINEECNRISSESIEKLILERQNIKFQNDQKVIELKNYANENTEKLEKINKLIEKHDSLANSKNTLLNNNNMLDVNLTNYQSLLSKIPDSINEYKYEIEKSNQKINELQNEIEQLKIDIEDLENDITKLNNKINKDIEKPTKKEIDNLISKRIEKNKIELDFVKKQGMLENKLSNIMKYKNDIIDAKNQIEILNVKLKKYQDVIEVCGKNGYQKAKMKAIVPLLEIKSNELVKQFTQNDNLSIKFDLDPKTKSGKLKKCGGLEIIIQNGNNERKLNMYSGGETVIITFSILLSLAEILSERRGSKLKTLIIDERISGLDNENINQFIEVINKISSKFERIIVISHITEILSAFDDSIIIEKNENGSYIVE